MKTRDLKAKTTEIFTLNGQITQEGKSFAGAIVRAYDKDLRREELLGKAITDQSGNYKISYDFERYAQNEKANADLFIRVFNTDEKLLGTSDVVFNAPSVQEVNFAIGAAEKSEWEQLNELLLALLKEQKRSDYKPAVLYENLPPAELQPADINFLASDTGIAEETLRKWSMAYAVAIEQNDIPSEVFYAWFSRGLPEKLSDLWKLSIEQLMDALKEAIENGIVPVYTDGALKKLRAKIQRALDVATKAPLMEKIEILFAGFERDQKLEDQFTQVYLKYKGDWSVIKPLLTADKAFPEEFLGKVFFTHGLMDWTDNNTVLIETFKQDAKTDSLWDVAINFNKQALANEIPDTAIPSSETRENFTTALYDTLYTIEPTAVVVNMINDPKIPLWNNEMGSMVSGVLSKMPEFNIKTTSVYELINNPGVVKMIPNNEMEGVISNLKILQRVTLLSPIPEAVPALINNNYLSAYTITMLPQAQFVATMYESGLPYETLGYIYEAAEKKKAFYEQVLIKVKETGERTGIAMIDGGDSISAADTRYIDPEVEADLAKNNLSWNLLFGDADFCECGECTSVYSAAAYYVDLLQYLRNNNLDTSKTGMDAASIANTPLEALFARRPDLGHLELTCKNTNTILPYVDLVNEVMEQYIAFKVKAADFENYKGFNVANEISGELLAAPQHTEQHEAYQALSRSVFPFTLPYHQPIDATRIFLNQLSTSRYEVINTFRNHTANINFDRAAAAEFLGLTEEEYAIITKESFDGVANNHTTAEYYGLKDITNWIEQLSGVKDELLPRTGIQYTELVALLKTKYINPNLAQPEYMAMLNSLSQPFSEALDSYEDDMGGDNSGVFFSNPNLKILLEPYDEDTCSQKLSDFFKSVVNCIVLNSPDNRCILDDVKLLHYDNAHLTGTDYDRVHRFIRLWRKLGFTIDETDQAIMVLGEGDITPELIHQLVALKKIKDQTGIELAKLLCFWGNIGTSGQNALYKRLFMSYNLTAMDRVFDRDLTGNETLSDHLPVVMAALNLSADDIASIEIYKSLPEPLTLSLEHLTLLYRYRLLSKTLELRIPAFIKLLEVVGNVFEDPDTTLHFLQNVSKIEKAGFTIDQLCYIINGADNNSNSFFPTKKDVIVLAKKIYDGQIAIETEHADLGADVTATYLREKLIQTHIVTTLSEQTGLDKTTVQSLVLNILKIDGVSLYDQLTSSRVLPVPNTPYTQWYGKLIPVSEDDFTFVVRAAANATFKVSLDNHVILNHTGTQANGATELQSAALKLLPGKVYQLSLEGILLENLYWKTKISSVEPIPAKALLPDFKKKATRAALEKLEKMAILVNVLSLSADELNYLHANRSDFSDIDLNDLSFYHLLRVVNYCNLRDSLPKTGLNVLQFWERLNNTETGLSEQIAQLTKWKKERIDMLISSTHFNLAKADFKNEKNLLRLQYALAVASKIGMDIDKLFEWAIPTSDFIACKIISDNIQKAVRAKYNQTDWEQVVKPLNDQLRNNQKNALITYLLQQPELRTAGVTDADGLFEYFLIDVQMDTCMETSRIKQAISSVQLFIQRCFLGLEAPDITPTVLSRERWEWMQRYRVWEANRKVFLYPENWIESDLRDDKSPFFKELESELLQKDINKQNVTDALKNYLYKVDEVADMEVVGLYIEGEKTSNGLWSKGAKLHIFSRTRNVPCFFYYRYLCLDEMNWYPWEKVQVDIPSYDVEDANGQITGNGCYLSPVIWNGRLLIFFPQIVKKTKPNPKATGRISAQAELTNEELKPIEYYEIKMAWSEYRNGKWTQKQIGKNIDQTHVISESSIHNTELIEAQKQAIRRLNLAEQKERTCKEQKENAEEMLDIVETSNGKPASAAAINIRRVKLREKADAYNRSLEALEAARAELQSVQDAMKNATSSNAIEVIGKIYLFEFVPVHSDDDILLAIKVFYQNNEVGILEFNGNSLQQASKSYSRNNLITPNYFHYTVSSEGNSSLSSLQTNGTNNYYFNRTPESVNFNSIHFFHPFTRNLLGIINSNKQEDFFTSNLNFGTIYQVNQRTETNIADAFGKSMDSSDNKIYHELKRPYSLYNWELFFHTPIMIADALSKAQQFEESMKWFHYVFNPIADGVDDKRFWGFRPFKEADSKNILEHIFAGLKANEPDEAINEWRNNPFKPHVVARSRPVAYMKWVVMKYIDNILDWGDYLFRQDTIESINQATQLYVLAGHILGRKPMMIPKRGEVKAQTYRSLMDKWDAFSNAISELEVSAVYNIQQTEYTGMNVSGTTAAGIFGSASALYFCIPNNPKLMGYWDTLADRLFKIRHCQNIEGVFRKLPLFEPPIDPGLLVKAAAQGLSISSVINDLNTPMPNYRFYYLLQKAQELCNELKSLGGAMLSAIEKKDNEAISLIRAKHEGAMNNMMMEIKKLQLEETQKSLESLQQNRKGPEARMKYYLDLIGDDSEVPGPGADFQELANSIEKPIDESGLKLSKYEKEDHDKSHAAHAWQLGGNVVEALAAIFHAIPNAAVKASPFGIGGEVGYGGTNLGNSANATSKVIQIISSQLSFEASNAAKKGGFQRVLQDRILQANAAGYELKQIDKQITAQQIRIDIANQEIRNQQKQMDNALEVEEFLKSKYTNEELYTWMRGSLKTLYRQVYNLTYGLAKKAEKTYCFEMGIGQVNFIQSGYFDAGREGLLAGEQLYVGLKQLEAAYQEKRGYDYEVTKHISIRQLDPLALLQLKTTGACEFNIAEVLFDMDYPGHFKRRIKSVSVSIPCIAGPYTGVNATLRLINNRFRSSSVANNYPEKMDEQDDRFTAFNIPIAAIATSSAQNDAGMFELNFKDERYLPFEGAGVISRWELELPAVKQFDYNTISDVVLHVKYTSSEGGKQLKATAEQSVISQLNQMSQQLNETGLHIAISLKYDLPKELNLLKQNGVTQIKIEKSWLPYFAQLLTRSPAISVMLVSESSVRIDGLTFSPLEDSGLQKAEISNVSLGNSFTLSGDVATLASLDELILMVKIGV